MLAPACRLPWALAIRAHGHSGWLTQVVCLLGRARMLLREPGRLRACLSGSVHVVRPDLSGFWAVNLALCARIAAVRGVGKGGIDDPEAVERRAGEEWPEAKGSSTFRVLSARAMGLASSFWWEARSNPQTVLRSHFTWCDDRQEILPRRRRSWFWSRSHTHRLDCLALGSRYKTPLGPSRPIRHHKHTFIPPSCPFC